MGKKLSLLVIFVVISLNGILANWVLQKKSSSANTNRCRVDKNEVLCKSPPYFEDEKAIWDVPFVGEGKAYWKLTFEYADTYEVGVTDRPDFRGQYSHEYLISTGSEENTRIVGNNNQTGTTPNPNIDVIGVLCVSTSKKFQVYFDVNGSAPELMYEIPRKLLKDKLFPVTSFQAKRVAIVQSNDVPALPDLYSSDD